MKIPEPIIDPTTSAVASSREIARTKSVWGGCSVVGIPVIGILARDLEVVT